jgi:hypothetical protein
MKFLVNWLRCHLIAHLWAQKSASHETCLRCGKKQELNIQAEVSNV